MKAECKVTPRMSINGVVQVFIENDVAAAVRPTADIHGNADGRRMTGSILDMHTHDGVLSTHALRAKTNGVDAVKSKTGDMDSFPVAGFAAI